MAEFVERVERRRTRALGLVRVLGVEPGEPVYFQPHLFGASPGWVRPRRFPLLPFPGLDPEARQVLARIAALPHVTAEEIAAAGFAPAPEDWVDHGE